MRAALTVLAAGLLILGAAALRVQGAAGAAGTAPSPEDREAAVDAVRTLISLSGHYRGAAGDERFLERIPATPPVLDELRREQRFATHLRAVTEERTIRADIADVRRVAEGRLEVDVTEYRITHTASEKGGEPVTRSDVVRTRYVVARLPGGWRILGRAHAPLMAPPRGG